MTGSRPITVVTFGSLAIAGLMGVVWLFLVHGTSRFEPAIASLGLLAGLTGILAERRAARRERRYLAVVTLAYELEKNWSSLNDLDYALRHEVAPRPRIYPRLAVSAVGAALVSGALTEPSDTPLLRSLHEWRDEVNSFNRRLDLTEMRIFATGRREEAGEFERILHDHGYLDHLRASLEVMITLLPSEHQKRQRHYDGHDHPVTQLLPNPSLDLTSGGAVSKTSDLETAQIDDLQVQRGGRSSHRYRVHALRIMLRTVMIVSARSKNAEMTDCRRS